MKKIIHLTIFLFSITLWCQDTKKVLIIGIDGCRPDALEIANSPNIDALIDNGIFSPDAINDDISISGPGWSANLCGVWSNKHLVTNNDFSGNNYAQYPPFFAYVEQFDSSLETASICHWAPINDFIIDDYADFKLNVSSDADVSSEAVNYISSNDPDVVFLHFDDVDHAGHAFGFSPTVPEYITAIEGVDTFLGPILNAIENRPSYDNEDWLILVTTDHGGINTSHGGNTLQEQIVFFAASGKNTPTQLIEKDITIVDPPQNCLNDPLELQFDGTDDFVSIPSNPLFDFGSNQDFTIECRIRTNSGGDVSVVGNKNWSSGLNPGFVISFALPEGEQWKVNIGDGNNRVDVNSGGVIIDNEWHTLSVSFDRDGLMRMYLNGQFVDEANIASIGDIDTGVGLLFGADTNNAFDFSGAISEVRVWDTILDGVDINSWHCTRVDNSHPNFGSLIGYWKLNEDTGSVAIDSSVHQNDGIVNNAIWDTPNLEVYDYSETPRLTDVPYTALTHLCIPIEANWELDGESWITECDILSTDSTNLSVDIQMSPNPTESDVTILIKDFKNYDKLSLEIFNVSGKKIHSQELLNSSTTLKLSNILSGVYFVKIKTASGFIIKKFLKQS